MSSHKNYPVFLFALFVFVVGFLPGKVCADEQVCFSPLWPQEKSDLSPDPSITFGRLDNGFRYILKKNSEPADRVAMFLDVQAGSLNETDAERGYAHFLEHMLFNGSTHFPPGKLVEYFQSIGMSFGGDTNAHTGYDETVYNVILPDGKKKNIETGLLVLADYARGALLLDEEVERERGVILAEKRSRDSAQYRAHVAEIKFSMQGSLVAERMPIGLEETLNKADHIALKRFYDAWYRPSNMILLMVGDFDPDTVRPLVEEQFRKLQAAGSVPPCPEYGAVRDTGTRFFYHYEAEMGNSETGIETLWNEIPQNDSFTVQKEDLIRYAATKILQYRLDELGSKADTPFTSASTYSGNFLGRVGYGEISAKCDPQKWKESLQVVEKTLRQALEFGFLPEELQRAKKELQQLMDSEVLTVSTRNSRELAAGYVTNLNQNKVIRSPEQDRQLMQPVLDAMTLTDVEQAFRAVWNHPARYVKVSGNAHIAGDNPLQQVENVYRAAEKQKVSPVRALALAEFPYLQMKKLPEKPVKETELKKVGSKRLEFANHVILNLKKTHYKKNEVLAVADFGMGQAGEPLPGLTLLTENVMNRSGTSSLSKGELDKILAGSGVKFSFRVNPAAFTWSGKLLAKDMELFFQILQSLLADPGVDPDGYQVAMDFFSQQYKTLAGDMQGVMPLHGDAFLAGGNKVFGLPPWEEFAGLTIEDIQKWVLPAAERGPLEISIVGDFDEKAVAALAEQYLSTLPDRENMSIEKGTVGFPKGETLALQVPTSIDKALLLVAWKSDDFWDIQQTRGLHLLADIFSDKLRSVIRERMGASYSPQVYNLANRIYKGYGLLQARLIVDPGQVDVLKAEVLNIAESVYRGEISEEELARAKAPAMTALKDMVRTNSYWLRSVLSLSARYPQQLEWPSTILESFAGFTVSDMQRLSRKFLNPEDAAVVEAVPGKGEVPVIKRVQLQR